MSLKKFFQKENWRIGIGVRSDDMLEVEGLQVGCVKDYKYLSQIISFENRTWKETERR